MALPPHPATPGRWVVMGVCGCGKSTVGAALAQLLAVPFLEGDKFHPAANVAKMSAGIPLDDADRAGWLQALAGEIGAARARGEGLVVSCSALKRRYRDLLRQADSELRFVHLHGARELIAERLRQRTDHYMPPPCWTASCATWNRCRTTKRAFVSISRCRRQIWWRASRRSCEEPRCNE